MNSDKRREQVRKNVEGLRRARRTARRPDGGIGVCRYGKNCDTPKGDLTACDLHTFGEEGAAELKLLDSGDGPVDLVPVLSGPKGKYRGRNWDSRVRKPKKKNSR